mmetsp:Transcript_46409/g.110566  ORF Transcript_46409/g.110566 Transcript_46409/m.110566 type:complete len:446 (+) Transcript_46409:96-1433(+)
MIHLPGAASLLACAFLLIPGAQAARVIRSDAVEGDVAGEASTGKILEEQAQDVDDLLGPPLCDTWVVQEACRNMDEDGDPVMASTSFLTEVLSIPHPSLVQFLVSLGFEDADEQDKFKCMELCQAIVEHIPVESRPPSSDVACRSGDEDEPAVVCDVDVSSDDLADIEFDTEGHDFHTGHPVGNSDAQHHHQMMMSKALVEDDDNAEHDDNKVDVKELEDVEESELLARLANWFRIYPLLQVDIDDDVEELEQGGTSSSLAEAQPKKKKNWMKEVEKVNVKARAYVAKALQVAPKRTSLMKQWFGTKGKKTKKEVMRVLNSLSGMLGNVAFKKGPECAKTTYAYVYPYGPLAKNNKKEFVFYLCDLYFKSPLGLQIETLTHEGSHHAMAYTTDVCADRKVTDNCKVTAYGRKICRKLAKYSPKRAIQNADSFCFFINDVNGHRPR